MFNKKPGFTIVELLIVIVVIGILAAISIVAYNGIQERSQFTTYKSELKNLNTAINLYYAEQGHYPITAYWSGNNQNKNDAFIPGLVPDYISETPQVEPHGEPRPTFLYLSNADGSGYKLIYIVGTMGSGETLPAAHTNNNPMIEPYRPNRAWGYWTDNMASV